MPSTKAIKKTIQRRRCAVSAAPLQPASRASIVIPQAYQTYGGQEQFLLLYYSGLGDDDRLLIFGRQSNMAWSAHMKHLYADGIFKITPPLFTQVYVLMAERDGFVRLVLYALLPDKRETTYRRMFEAVKEMWPQLSPDSVAMDFEQAVMNAFRATFPGVQIWGCFFHLMRNFKRKLAQRNLLRKYRSNTEFAVAARMIVAMAFVPTDAIDDVFGELSVQSPADLVPVLDWFEDTYIGRPTRRGSRREPMFPPQMWSVHNRTLIGHDRTSNFVEAAH